jgi:hypothetical protein
MGAQEVRQLPLPLQPVPELAPTLQILQRLWANATLWPQALLLLKLREPLVRCAVV